MYEKYQVIVFVEVQLIKNHFFKNEQTRSTQNVVNTSMLISINMKYLLTFLQKRIFE